MKGAIFDVDGTILDSMYVWRDVIKKYFDDNEIVYNDSLNEKFMHMTLNESTAFMHSELGFTQVPEKIFEELEKFVSYEYTHNIQLKPYVREYLEKLKSKNVVMGIATSGYGSLCEAALRRLKVWDMFSAIALSDEVGVNKSHPDVYLLAAKRMDIEPQFCTVYEDILSGIIGAKKADMYTIGVYDKSCLEKDEMKSESDLYIMSFKELL